MKVGVSTACFYPELTEKALINCGELGSSVSEIFFNSPCELENEFLNKLVSIKEHYGISITSVHPFTCGYEPYLLFSSYERRFDDTRDFYKKYACAAQKLGAGIVVIHGDRIQKSVLSAEEYTERFLTLARDLEEYGVILAQENVNLYRPSSPDFIRKMRKLSGDTVNFVYDVKQTVRAGFSPLEVLDAMGEKIVHVHLSDHSADNDCVLPGQGSFDFNWLAARLNEYGYSGDAVIEVYSSAFKKLDEMTESLHFTQSNFTYTKCR